MPVDADRADGLWLLVRAPLVNTVVAVEHPDDIRAAEVVFGHCYKSGYTDVEHLEGGDISCVVAATTPAGERVVVKNAGGPSERRWLERHPAAPAVHPHTVEDVLVMWWVDGTLLLHEERSVAWTEQLSWVSLAQQANGPVCGDEPRIVDLHRWCHNVGSYELAGWQQPERELTASYLEWLDSEPLGARSAAVDVVSKNVIVDRKGRWWQVDPWCVRGPDELTWAHWAVDRSHQAAIDDVERLWVQGRFVAASPDPEATAACMPSAALWQLWWRTGQLQSGRWTPELLNMAARCADDALFWLEAWRHLL